MRIGIPAPARVRPRPPGPIVPGPKDIYYGAEDFYRHRLRPAGRAARRLIGQLMPWFLAIGLALFLQFIIRNWPVYRVVTVVLFIFVVPLLVKRVELTIIINYIFISGLVAIPKPITVGGQGFKPHELIILLGVLSAFYGFYASREKSHPRSPLTLPLVLFLTSLIIALALSWKAYLAEPRGPFPFRETYNEIRPLFAYLTFFIFLYGIRTEQQLKWILRVAFGVCAIVGVLMVVQYFVGPGTRIFFGRVEQLQEGTAVVTRSLPPGMALVLVYFPLAVYLAARAPLRNSIWYILLASSLGVGILFSMTRNWWLSTLLSMFILAVLSRRTIGVRVLLYGATVVLISIALSVMMGSRGIIRGQGFAQGLQQRLASSFRPKADRSYRARMIENRRAIAKLKHHWLLGMGAGATIHYLYEYNMGRLEIRPMRYIHNCYLEIWLLYGLLGIVSFVWLEIAFIVRCLRIYRNARDDLTKALAIAFLAAFIGAIMRSWITMNMSREPHSIIAIVGMWGTLESAWRIYQGKRLAGEQETMRKQAA